MYAVSDRWDAALRSSGVIVSRVEVWRDGVFTGRTLNVTGGSVRVDDSSKVRRRLTMSCSDVDLMPNDANDFLRPTDTDLKVYTGVQYTEGDSELVPVFTGRISEPARNGWNSGLDVAAVDYAKVLEDARFGRPWNVSAASNTRAFTLLSALVKDVLPWVNVFNLTGRNDRIGGVSFDKSRVEAIDLLARACGGEWWFTPDGDMVVGRPARSLTPEPDWFVDAGTPTSVLTNSGQSMNSDRVYNAVTATYTPQDGAPVSVSVFLTTGPLRYRPGFQRFRFFKTTLPTTPTQLRATAQDMLRRSAQLGTRVSASAAPNPALEIGDVVQVALPDGSAVKRLVNGFTVPLSASDVGSDGMPLDLVTPAELSEIGDVDQS